MTKQLQFGVVADPSNYNIETCHKLTIEGSKFTDKSFEKAHALFMSQYEKGDISNDEFPDNITIANIIPLRDGKLFVKYNADAEANNGEKPARSRTKSKVEETIESEFDESELVAASKHVTEVARIYAKRQTLLEQSQAEFEICKAVGESKLLSPEQIDGIADDKFGVALVEAARATVQLQTMLAAKPDALLQVKSIYETNASTKSNTPDMTVIEPTAIAAAISKNTKSNGRGKSAVAHTAA